VYPRLLNPPERQSFFLFGPRGVGKTAWLHQRFPGLRRFREDYPKAKAFFVYTGSRRRHEGGIEIMPAADALHSLGELLG
jgi:hypothetical protein